MPHEQFHEANELGNEKDEREDNEAQERMTKNLANDVAVQNTHEHEVAAKCSMLQRQPRMRYAR